MNRSLKINVKYVGAALSAVFAVAAFLYFAIPYGAHICYQEQYQLFEWNWKYFSDTVFVPGGFADWCGRFLTQFFFNKWVGAAILALCLTAVQLLCFLASKRRTVLSCVCSFVPAAFLLLYFLESTALLGAVVAVMLALACALIVRRMNVSVARTALIFVLVPLLYLLCGPAALIFALALPEGESVASRLAAVLLLVAMPFALMPVCHYPLKSLLTGIHYNRITQFVPVFLWHAIGAAFLYVLVAGFRFKEMKPKTDAGLAVVLLLVLAVGGVSLVRDKQDMEYEELMEYDRMAYLQDWDGIIKKASDKLPDKPLSVSVLNLALAKKDLLGDWQFAYFQSGEAGLFPSYAISFFALLPTSEIYWQLGMVSACQQYVFEAQEAIPDFQKSARCYKRLCEAYIVNRDYDVARKYLRALCHTLHYRKWALDKLEMLEDESAVEAAYGEIRSLRVTDPYALFNENNKASMLRQLIVHNPDNSLARQYLYSLMILEQDLESFEKEMLSLGPAVPLPKYWQEALIMQWVITGRDFSSLPENVSEENVKRMRELISAMRGGRNNAYLKRVFGNTYWFYCSNN